MTKHTRVSIENQGPGTIEIRGLRFGPLSGGSWEVDEDKDLVIKIVPPEPDGELYNPKATVKLKYIAALISTARLQYLTDRDQNITGVIVPFEPWREIEEAVEVDDD